MEQKVGYRKVSGFSVDQENAERGGDSCADFPSGVESSHGLDRAGISLVRSLEGTHKEPGQ